MINDTWDWVQDAQSSYHEKTPPCGPYVSRSRPDMVSQLINQQIISNNEMCVRCAQTHRAHYFAKSRFMMQLVCPGGTILPTSYQAQPHFPQPPRRKPPSHCVANTLCRFPVFPNASLFSHASTIPDIMSQLPQFQTSWLASTIPDIMSLASTIPDIVNQHTPHHRS